MSADVSRQMAQNAERWEGLQWWELEAGLFREHPKIRSALSTMSPTAARRYFAKGRVDPLQPIIALLYLVGPVLPAVALVVLASRHVPRQDGVSFLPATILVAIAVLLGTMNLIGNVRHRDEVEPRTARMIGWVHLVPSLILLVFVVQALATGRSADARPWMAAVFALDVIVGVLYLVLTPRPKDRAAARIERARARWRRAMATLSAADQQTVRAELGESIDVLIERGLIDQATADQAREAPLGLLGITLAPAT